MISQIQSEKGGPATTAAATTTIRPLSGLRNPRIVRASREFGGKDRHSKVSTVKGLRDRRVRLSVPTAIQLYDLQDKLGLNQPSKVVDWLLSKAQNEIDKLPPLQFPLPENSNFANFSENLGLSREANGKDLLSTSAFLQSAHWKQGFDSNDPYISYYPWEQASNAYFSQLGIITRAGTHRPDTSDITPSSMSLLADPSQMVNLCTPKIVPPMMFAPMHGGFDGSLVLQNPQSNSQRINDQPLFQ